MNRMRIALLALACIGLVAVGVSAQAGCLQSNLTGTWQAYVANDNGTWTRCSLKFNSAGKVTAGSCVDSDGGGAQILSGKLAVKSSCLVTGAFSMSGGGGTVTIQHATMGKDKCYLLGVGRDNTGGLFKFDAAKK